MTGTNEKLSFPHNFVFLVSTKLGPGNDFSTIPESIGGCISLRHLDISKNLINKLPFSLGVHLKSLACQGTFLQSVANVITFII